MAPEDPHRIGPYEILGVAGTGTRGAVYKARRTLEEGVVAIKVLSPRSQRKVERAAKFERELDILAGLPHPNILRVIDRGQDGDQLYVVMEYVDGTSLAGRLATDHLTLAAAIHVVREAAKGLAFAHRHGVMHGCLNPNAILVARDLSAIKLKAFAEPRARVSAAEAGTVTAALSDIRTLPYWAPEARDGGATNERADVYSLGVVCYEALTGTVPSGKFNLPSELNRQLPLELDPIVLKCLASDPAQRYGTVADFLKDLDKVEEVEDYQLISELKRLSGGRLFKGKPTDGAIEPPRRNNILMAAGGVILALIVVGAAIGFLRGRAPSTVPAAPEVAQSAQAPGPGAAAPAHTAPNPTRPDDPPARQSPAQPALAPAVAAPARGAEGAPAIPATPAPPPAATSRAGAAPPSASQAPVSGTTAGDPGSAGAIRPNPPATSAKPAPRLNEEAARAFAPIKASIDAGKRGTAVDDLRAFLTSYDKTPSAPDAYLLLAEVQDREGRPQDAIVTYEEIARRYRGDARVAAALFSEAKLLEKTKAGDAEVRKRLAIIGEEYANSTWFVPAMTTKVAIEDKARLKELDPAIGVTVPASLLTRRLLVERAPLHPAAEQALWKMGEMYEDLKQYGQAAKTYVTLGSRFPGTKFDAWFKAADLYEHRLNARDEARTAYLKVPAASSRYRDSQDRARKLAGK
jgi:TolA-binding protein